MSEFINTIDVLGDDAVTDSFITRTITEFKDDVITEVGMYAFCECTVLTVLDLPNVSAVAANAFESCRTLTTLILRSTTRCALSNANALNNTPIKSGTGYVYVPSALVDSYKNATNWATVSNQIRAIEDYPEITGG